MKKWLSLFVICLLVGTKVMASDEIYFTAQGLEDNNPLVYRGKYCDKGYLRDNYPFQISIAWEYKLSENNGLPELDVSNLQFEFEEAIIHLDDENFSHLMLVRTGNHLKKWLWYVKDEKEWMIKFNQALTEHPIYPLEIDIEYEPNWDVYQSFMDYLDTSDSTNDE